jgi:ferric-dicitrate binding protein FerR (iron transport regulator)
MRARLTKLWSCVTAPSTLAQQSTRGRILPKYALTNLGYMALGIYIGFKPGHRRSFMLDFGIDYEVALAEFRKVGLAKGSRVNLAEARIAFNERFPGQLGSQTHQYRKVLGFERAGALIPAIK